MSLAALTQPTPYMRQRKQLVVAICIAFIIHLLLAGSFSLQPANSQPPAKSLTLKVKLGSGGSSAAPLTQPPIVKETPNLDRDHSPAIAPVKKKAKSNSAARKKTLARKTRKQVQSEKKPTQANQASALVSGDALGNKQRAQQLQAKRYTQQLSLWIDKFKIYPPSARQAGIEGQVVVNVVIDQQGNIINYALKQPSPYPILNQSVLDAVRRANPVPAVPEIYPNKDKHLGFNIGLKFKLK